MPMDIGAMARHPQPRVNVIAVEEHEVEEPEVHAQLSGMVLSREALLGATVTLSLASLIKSGLNPQSLAPAGTQRATCPNERLEGAAFEPEDPQSPSKPSHDLFDIWQGREDGLTEEEHSRLL